MHIAKELQFGVDPNPPLISPSQTGDCLERHHSEMQAFTLCTFWDQIARELLILAAVLLCSLFWNIPRVYQTASGTSSKRAFLRCPYNGLLKNIG